MSAFSPPLMVMPVFVCIGLTGLTDLFGVSIGLEVVRVPLSSSQHLTVTIADLISLFGLFTLGAELLRGMNGRPGTVVANAGSLLLFVACMALFIFAPWCGTTTFLLLTAMTLMATVIGFATTVALSRGNIWVDNQ